MMDLFGSLAFKGLSRSVEAALLKRYFDLYEKHAVAIPLPSFDLIDSAHEHLCLQRPEHWELAPLKQVHKELKKKISDLPIPALLATHLPHERTIKKDYENLLFWTTAASFALLHLNTEDQSRIRRACDAVRLMAREKEEGLLQFFHKNTESPNTILRVAIKQEALNGKRYAEQRFAPLRVLMTALINQEPPIRRKRDRETERATHVSKTYKVLEHDLPTALSGDISVSKTITLNQSSDNNLNPEYDEDIVEYHVSPMGTRQEKGIAPLQKYRARNVIYDTQLRKMALPCVYGTPTDYEISLIFSILKFNPYFSSCQELEGRDDALADALIITGIILSMLPWDVMALLDSPFKKPKLDNPKAWFEEQEDKLIYCRSLGLTNHDISAKETFLLGGRPRAMRLTLPNEFSAALKKIKASKRQGQLDESYFKARVKSRFSKTGRQQTLRRLSNIMQQKMTHANVDRVIIAYLSGETQNAYAGLYYATPNNADLETTFRNMVNSLTEFPLTWPKMIHGYSVGSALNVKLTPIKLLFREAQKELEAIERINLRDQILYHNRYVSLVTMGLSLMTGHRPVRAPFESLSDYDFDRKWLYISDKSNKRSIKGRFVPVPAVFDSQIRLYLEYLQYLQVSQLGTYKAVESACEGAREATQPLLFFIRDKQRESRTDSPSLVCDVVSPHFLRENTKDYVWPLPLNWGRHVLRDILSDRNSGFSNNNELANALMGHTDIGFEPLSLHSGIPLGSHMEALRGALDIACKKMKLIALRGHP